MLCAGKLHPGTYRGASFMGAALLQAACATGEVMEWSMIDRAGCCFMARWDRCQVVVEKRYGCEVLRADLITSIESEESATRNQASSSKA